MIKLPALCIYIFQRLASILKQTAIVDPEKIHGALAAREEDRSTMKTQPWKFDADDGQLTHQQISSLAASISARDMVTIAEGYLDIYDEVVQELQYNTRADYHALKKDIISNWCQKNPGTDQIKVSRTNI